MKTFLDVSKSPTYTVDLNRSEDPLLLCRGRTGLSISKLKSS